MNCGLCGKPLYDLQNGPFHVNTDDAIECYNQYFMMQLEPEPDYSVKPGIFQLDNWDKVIHFGLAVLLSAILVYAVLSLTSCGAPQPITAIPAPVPVPVATTPPISTQTSTPDPPTPTPAPAPSIVSIAGQWNIKLISSVYNVSYLVPCNLQQSGNSVSASPQQLALLQILQASDSNPAGYQIGINGVFAGSLVGTVNGNTLSFIFTEADANVPTYQIAATIRPDANTITGTYVTSSNNDNGTVTGQVVPLLSGTYNGSLTSPATYPATTETASLVLAEGLDSSLDVTGTVNTEPIALEGSVIGSYFTASGTIDGQLQPFIGYLPGDGSLQLWETDYFGVLQQN
jgi:hypothetical protein